MPDFVGYTERHHKLPKSPGGSDLPTNLVSISARKHFLCHYLLTKFTLPRTQSWYSMIRAFNMMCVKSNTHLERYMNSRFYEQNKKNLSQAMSLANSNTNNPQYGKIWMTNTIIDVSRRFNTDQVEDAINQGWVIGRKSTQFKNKMKSSYVPKVNSIHLIGKTVEIYRNGIVISTKMLYFYRDYLLSGWALMPTTKSSKGRIRITNDSGKNLTLPKDIAKNFIDSGLWRYGATTPNHIGTTGKKWKTIDGKRIMV